MGDYGTTAALAIARSARDASAANRGSVVQPAECGPMKKCTPRTLILRPQTLRILARVDLNDVAGGMDGTERDGTCAICAPSMPSVCPGPTPI